MAVVTLFLLAFGAVDADDLGDNLRIQFLHDLAMSSVERSSLFVGAPSPQAVLAATAAIRFSSANAAVSSTQISDTGTYSAFPPVISIVLVNTSWEAQDVLAYFVPSVDNHDDPYGWAATLSSQTAPLNTGTAANVMSLFRFNISGSMSSQNGLNLTLPLNTCFQPKLDDSVTILFDNASTLSGHSVGDSTGTQPVSFTVLAGLSQAASDGGRIIVTIAATAAGVTFVLGNWFEALLVLMQLQTIVILSQMTCAPRDMANIFSSSKYVVWPMQIPFASAIGGTEQQLLGRLLFAFILAAVTLVVQVVSLGFFSLFGKKGGTEPFSRIKFPAGTLFVCSFLMQGAMFIAVRIFALQYQSLLSTSTSIALPMSIIAFLSIVALIVVVWAAVFRLVSRQIFQPPSYKSLVLHFLLGGRWDVTDALKQWGVIYEGVNDRNFWYLASYHTLNMSLIAFAGFLPGSRSMCSTQLFVMLAVQVLSTVIVFLRQPFKSAALNILNIAISLLTTLVVASMITSSQCSRAGNVFAEVAAWAAMTAIVLKSIVALVTQSTKRLLGYKEAVAKQRRMLLVTRAANGYGEQALPNGTPGGADFLKPRDAVSSAAAVVYSLTDDHINALEGAGTDFSSRSGAIYKPRMPHPVVIGSCIAFREVGFGGSGGLRTVEGPSVALRLSNPCGICCDGEFVYIADKGNHRILRHSPALQRTVTLVGGNGPGYSGEDRYLRSVVKLNSPMFLALGQRCLFISDVDNSCVRCFDFSSSQIHTVVGGIAAPSTTHLSFPMGLCVVGNLLYICDSGNHRVVCYDAEENSARVIAGTKFAGFDANNTIATAARLNNPQSVCVRRGTGVLYIADTGNFRVVSIDPSNKRLSIVIGLSGIARDTEAHGRSLPAAEVALVLPTDVACAPNKGLLVVDAGASKIWLINQFGLAHVLVGPNEVFLPRCIAVSKPSMEGHDAMYGIGDTTTSSNAVSSAARPFGTLGPSGSLLQSAVSRHPAEHLLFHVSDYINSVVATVDASTSSDKMEFSPRRLRQMEFPLEDPTVALENSQRRRAAAGSPPRDGHLAAWQRGDDVGDFSQLLDEGAGRGGIPMQQIDDDLDPFIAALRPSLRDAANKSPTRATSQGRRPPEARSGVSENDDDGLLLSAWRDKPKYTRPIDPVVHGSGGGISARRDRSGRTIGVELGGAGGADSSSSPFVTSPTSPRFGAGGSFTSLGSPLEHVAENADAMSNLLAPRNRQHHTDQVLQAASKPLIPGLNPLPAEHEAVRLHAHEGDMRLSSSDYTPMMSMMHSSTSKGSAIRVVALKDTVTKGMSDAIDLLAKLGRGGAAGGGTGGSAEPVVLHYPNPHGRVAREMQIYASSTTASRTPRGALEGQSDDHMLDDDIDSSLSSSAHPYRSSGKGKSVFDHFVTATSTSDKVFYGTQKVTRSLGREDEADSEDDTL